MITFVTALYDLGRGNLQGQWQRSFPQYLERFETLLRQEFDLVVFSDNDKVEELTKKYPTAEFMRQSIEQRYPNIDILRTDDGWLNQTEWLRGSPQANLPLYNHLVFSKMKMLQKAIDNDLFDNRYYVWIDAGINVNFQDNFELDLLPWLQKVFLCEFSYENSKEIHGFPTDKMNFYSASDIQTVVRAQIFGGCAEQVWWSQKVFDHLAYRTLSDGYMGTEENILTIMRYLFPTAFDVYKMPRPTITAFIEAIEDGRVPKDFT